MDRRRHTDRRHPAEIEKHSGTGMRIAVAVVVGWVVVSGGAALLIHLIGGGK